MTVCFENALAKFEVNYKKAYIILNKQMLGESLLVKAKDAR